MLVAATFHQLPSQIARPLMHALGDTVGQTDWYAFDVAAAARWWQMRNPTGGKHGKQGKRAYGGEHMPSAAHDTARHAARHPERMPDAAAGRDVTYETDPSLPLELGGVLHGTEIPPWER